MNVTVTRFIPELHYAEISRWWKAAKWPVIPLDHLAQVGIVSVVNGIPAAAGWIYQSDSAFCLFEFMVANPSVRAERRHAGFSALFSEAKAAAQRLGFQTIIMSVSNDSLIRRLEANGFSVSDRGMTNLIYKVGG